MTSAITRQQLATAAFPCVANEIRVCETHLSFVVLTGELAYKVKKAVKLDFIDTTSLEQRRQLCEEELRLNRRYAADLYVRVVAITFEADTLRFDGIGEPIEYAVEMRQFDSREELQSLLETRAVTQSDLASLADCIADFHCRALVRHADDCVGTQAYLRKARENLTGVATRIATVGGESALARLRSWSEARLSEDIEHLKRRERETFFRECHGDLHSGNVVRWRGTLVPFDCIEFDAELRFIDVLNDVAFLVMDLIARDRSDLAFTLLNRYLERTGDYAGVPLLPSYIVYRALVRTKVELIALEQHDEASDCSERANSYLRTALSFAYPQARPALIIMHGASGSGKSWLSAQLVPKVGAVRIRSDLERKRIAGVDPFAGTPIPNQAMYSLEFNERTYAHLRERAKDCLHGGVNAIVDAAFLKVHERRELAALAQEQQVPFMIHSCNADAETLAARIASRRAARNDPSDADERVMRRQLKTMEPFADEERAHLIEIDTRASDALARVLSKMRRIREQLT